MEEAEDAWSLAKQDPFGGSTQSYLSMKEDAWSMAKTGLLNGFALIYLSMKEDSCKFAETGPGLVDLLWIQPRFVST